MQFVTHRITTKRFKIFEKEKNKGEKGGGRETSKINCKHSGKLWLRATAKVPERRQCFHFELQTKKKKNNFKINK